jgi:hypothetical protein
MSLTRSGAAIFCGLLAAGPAAGQPPRIGACVVFPADNIWNTPVENLPVTPQSSAWVNTIGAAKTLHADFGAGFYRGRPIGIPFLAGGNQRKFSASFRYAAESDPGPYAVPLDAPIEGGPQGMGDRHTLTIDTGDCVLYELYQAHPQAEGWAASSGAIYRLKSNDLRAAGRTSADAAGLPIFSGLARYDEIVAGEIRHALRFTVPKTRRAYVWPARHYASALTGAEYPPMGARFRLRAGFDLSGFSPANRIILRALQKYGMMIADEGQAWFLSGAPDARWNDADLRQLSRVAGADFEAVDVSGLMIDPDSGRARQPNSAR